MRAKMLFSLQMFFFVLNIVFPGCYLQTRLAVGCVWGLNKGLVASAGSRGELAGATESLAADLMTNSGSKLWAKPGGNPSQFPEGGRQAIRLFVLLLPGF